MATTITFDEKNKGWTSFHSWHPDDMTRLKNRLYSLKDGQLWLHEEEGIERNLFYDVQYDTWVETIINDDFSDVKVFKTVNLESSHPWRAELTTNLSTGVIETSEYEDLEGEFFAHTRQNEQTTDYSSVSGVKGIGRYASVATNTITVTGSISDNLNVGDNVYSYDESGETLTLVGVCASIIDDTSFTVTSLLSTPTANDLLLSIKEVRVESSEIRGYYIMLRMTSVGNEDSEIFAVNSEVFKSFD